MESRYDIINKVVEGHTVIVVRARDRELNRDVAIKTLRADHAAFPDRVAAFSAASKLAARVLHASLIPVIAARRVGTRIFTVSPWAGGIRLVDFPRPLDPAAVAGVVAQLADGMSVAHATGSILRGLNPSDILLRPDGLTLVMDLNKLQLPGEPSPLPPPGERAEVIRYLPTEARTQGGLIDGQTDIYCLGALTLELLTGVPPTKEGALDMKPALIAALTNPGPLGQLAKLAMTLAAPRPDQRPQSVAKLSASLARFWTESGHPSAKAAVVAILKQHYGHIYQAASNQVVTEVLPGSPAPTPAPGAPTDPPAGLGGAHPALHPVATPSRPTAPRTPSGGVPRPAGPANPPRPAPAKGGAHRNVPPLAEDAGSGQPSTEELEPSKTGELPMVAVEEVESALYEENTTETERQAVKDAISGRVEPPSRDPWGLRSEGRFRSLDHGGFAADGNASGFAFVEDSSVGEVGPPHPGSRPHVGTRSPGSRPTHAVPRTPAPAGPESSAEVPRALAVDLDETVLDEMSKPTATKSRG